MQRPTPRTSARAIVLSGVAALTALTLSACGSNATAPAASAADQGIGSVDLKAAGCPANIVIQTDWNPESEHGHLYQLLGPNPTIDAANKSVSGPLYASGRSTGVNVEIRSGGPAIGFQTVAAQMSQDPAITLGYINTDEAVQLSAKMPTKAVFAPLDKNPQMIMWDPNTYKAKTIAELGPELAAKGGVVRYFGGSSWMEYLKAKGTLTDKVIDGSYDGTPANFVAGGGKDAQQGFASAEPYIYQNEVSAWKKPVAYQLIHDAGWQIYQAAVSVRAADESALGGCLAKLVPVLQQAEVDFFKDPKPVESLILDLVTEFNTGWVYSEGVADFSVKTMIEQKIVGNGSNSTLGDFDADRVKKVFDESVSLFTTLGSAPQSGLTAEDIYTNKYIDTSIGLK
ncbi:ABC transporter substrate-binding protein [Arthrobacter sp. ISL-5]|uniref:ABC transporter substrate-binding protein n=1 Tax=Arthrobacter sp. ISL-5 TaxID=2819111 RepID=UPI001BE71BD9|nr:ABC transporter substrate-binding protein [Arthrobacter sp. ISL-5]MBT2552505.1 ABC transporter substrate-binding protein [Arthrobacter sp. ISL-5]